MVTTTTHDHTRFTALGDSASCGVGDPTPDGWRGWAQILADALDSEGRVSFRKLAVPGATVADVRHDQLPDALAHHSDVTSLVVGLNDAMRSTWDPDQVRADLLHCADELARQGTLLLCVRFHDHTRALGLPGVLARPMRRRIQVLNEIYDEIQGRYGALRLDLAADPIIYDRSFWALDRLHPSELGHRWLARQAGILLRGEGVAIRLPSLVCTSAPPTRRDAVRTLVHDIVPWIARRARDLGPAVVEAVVRCLVDARHRQRREPAVWCAAGPRRLRQGVGQTPVLAGNGPFSM
ncbi:SGNH/GDSL hydrolase family protein [Nocardioides sp. NPDC023903]|uniref:SGNH/GDSL hydrolase family protein n=1 Tax=Nocardioides sp. NPDC023903 TaxID=3157195 RepID=UPI0033C4516C